MRTCKECAFFLPIDVCGGNCRRRAKKSSELEWPPVREDDWCGEFMPRVHLDPLFVTEDELHQIAAQDSSIAYRVSDMPDSMRIAGPPGDTGIRWMGRPVALVDDGDPRNNFSEFSGS